MMGCNLNEHGELSNRYKDLWTKKNQISLKLISKMTFNTQEAEWKFLDDVSTEIDGLSDTCVDLLAEHLQIPPNVFTEKKPKCS
jgi:hypothetical protein